MFINYYLIGLFAVLLALGGFALGKYTIPMPMHYFVEYHDGEITPGYSPTLTIDECAQDVFNFNQRQIEYLNKHLDDTTWGHMHAWCIP
jgi:hypothetical protein